MRLSGLAARASGGIERSAWLDATAARVHDLVAATIPDGARSALSGTWLGHPAHPFLVATPIGLWTGASLLDGLGQEDAARTLVGAGVLAVLPTAATGLSDWIDTDGAERRVGLVHLAANTVATSLYSMSWLARRRGRRSAGIGWALAGAGVASVGGWLGGHLAYALGVGVDTNAFGAGPIGWTALDVTPPPDGQPARAVAGTTPVLISDQGGEVRALADRCSHRGAPLSDGEVADGCVTCPWHGSRFSLATGEVVRGPAVVGQPTYEVRRAEGRIEVRRDEERALRTNSTQA